MDINNQLNEERNDRTFTGRRSSVEQLSSTSFLTEAQKELLEKHKVPKEIQQLLKNWLEHKGFPKEKMPKTSLDFLLLLSDVLMIAEKHLEVKRIELNNIVGNTTGFTAPSELPPEITSLEETIKEAWNTALSLWRVADEIIRDPEPYSIHITREHARYLIVTKNLTVLELIKLSYLHFFDWPAHIMIRQLCWFLGGIGGAFAGLAGGLLGGLKAGFKEHGITKIIFPFDAIAAMFIGFANGVVLGTRLGFRMANFYQGWKLAFLSAYLNPFRMPRGSKERQAFELMIEETAFNLSEQWEIKQRKKNRFEP